MAVALIRPDRDHLPAYVEAVERGFSPDNVRGRVAAEEELAWIARDADGYLAVQENPQGGGPPLTLVDGSKVARLPSVRRWIWDDGYCGSIGLRWAAPGVAELPEHVFGHIGYAVPEWKRGRRYATRALQLLLPTAREVGLPYVMITTDPDNMPSQKVAEAAGGYVVDRWVKPEAYGAGTVLRYRIDL